MPGVISTTRTDQETTISIRGRFNFEMYSQFRAAYHEDAKAKNVQRRYIVDLAGTEYIDSSALGLLLMLRGETEINGKTMVEIVNTRPDVLIVLKTANFHRLFKIT
ncbi:MAG: STAS domain-containing protein [Magnetococcales bacterium]|nr:STAS domain-containing protein [Magnetococcales bacterium]